MSQFSNTVYGVLENIMVTTLTGNLQPEQDDLLAGAIRCGIIEWLGDHSDLHVYEDYTEIYQEGRTAEQPGSHRVVAHRGSQTAIVRPRIERNQAILELIHEGRYCGWCVVESQAYDLTDRYCIDSMARQTMRWVRLKHRYQ